MRFPSSYSPPEKYDFEQALKFIEFQLWDSINKNVDAEAPEVIIEEYRAAHEHIVAACQILGVPL